MVFDNFIRCFRAFHVYPRHGLESLMEERYGWDFDHLGYSKEPQTADHPHPASAFREGGLGTSVLVVCCVFMLLNRFDKVWPYYYEALLLVFVICCLESKSKEIYGTFEKRTVENI